MKHFLIFMVHEVKSPQLFAFLLQVESHSRQVQVLVLATCSVEWSHRGKITSKCCLCAWQKLLALLSTLYVRSQWFLDWFWDFFPEEKHIWNVPYRFTHICREHSSGEQDSLTLHMRMSTSTFRWTHTHTHTRVKSQELVTHRFRACCIHRNVVSWSIKFLP